LADLGYDDLKNSKFNSSEVERKSAINKIRQRRKIGDLPPSYPNGWFAALESDDLRRSSAKELYILG
jgi:cholesterol 7-dehydrogenase